MSKPASWKDRIYESIGLKEWKYDRLDQSDAPDQPSSQPPHTSQQRDGSPGAPPPGSWSRSRTLKIAALVFAVFIFLVLITRPPSTKKISSLIYSEDVSSAYFYLVLPASAANTDFCKTVFSAAALDYPTPRIVNWNKKYENSDQPHGGHDLGRIEGIHDLLAELGSHTDDDLMLIADGYDSWFQLRPSVVIDRFYAINERANKRIAERMGSQTTIKQRIVFSAQKKCSSKNSDDLECYAVPPSELPAGIYGQKMDQDGDDGRPRYLNAGTVMGRVGDLRRLYNDAIDVAKEGKYKSDTQVLAHMFGEQEYQREVDRAQGQSGWQKFKSMFSGDRRSDIIGPDPKRQRPTRKDDMPPDYGIGLDYHGEISQPAEFAENDVAWIAHDSSKRVNKKAQRPGIPTEVPEDVRYSTPPFWTPDYTGYVKAPDADWSEVPLFTNLYTGVSPAIVRQGPGDDGDSDEKNPVVAGTWDQIWFLQYLRAILVAKARAPRMAHAVVQGADGPEEWWGPDDGRGGVRIDTGDLPGDWKQWHDVCGSQDVADKVLADSRGPWRNPGWMLDHDHGRAHDQLKDWFQQWHAVLDGTAVWGEKLP